MNYESQIKKLLDQLYKASGISFDISESELSEEDTITKLRELLLHFNTMENKSAFYKEYFSGKFSASEAALRLNRFHIKDTCKRLLVFLECANEYTSDATNLLKSMRPLPKDEIVEIDESHILLILHIEDTFDNEDFQQYTLQLLDMLESEAYSSFKISYDTICNTFSELLESYNCIVLAMKIGNVFYNDKRIYDFSDLGMGRLLYNIPKEECLAYINNNIDFDYISNLDEETIITLNAFFDNNLSLAETSRALFIHRNTLIYRIEKFNENTGLDIRKFKDALTCQICLMIVQFLKSKSR